MRSLRLLRIVSFLRLERMYNAMKNLRVIFARKKEELLVVTYLTAVVVLTASMLIFFLEHVAQPTVYSNFRVCVWWAVETITSLGYGDVVPITPMGRVLGASLALWGLILFTIPGAVLGSGFIEVMLEKQREEEAEMYSMAMGRCGSSVNSSNPLFVGSFSDDEQYHDHHIDHEHPEYAVAPAYTPVSVTSPSSATTPRIAAAKRVEDLHQKVDAIAEGQVCAIRYSCSCCCGGILLTRAECCRAAQPGDAVPPAAAATGAPRAARRGAGADEERVDAADSGQGDPPALS